MTQGPTHRIPIHPWLTNWGYREDEIRVSPGSLSRDRGLIPNRDKTISTPPAGDIKSLYWPYRPNQAVDCPEVVPDPAELISTHKQVCIWQPSVLQASPKHQGSQKALSQRVQTPNAVRAKFSSSEVYLPLGKNDAKNWKEKKPTAIH